jgi:hypothetical protein
VRADFATDWNISRLGPRSLRNVAREEKSMGNTPRNRSAVVAMVLLGIVVALPGHATAETMYAFAKNGEFFSIIDRSSGEEVVATGTPGILRWRGVAIDPVSGAMYATDFEYLYSIDLQTGIPTQIGFFGDVVCRDLAFDETGQLYGVTGNQGGDQHSLHAIDPSTGQATFVVPLSGSNSHALALDTREPGVLYHRANGLLEKINLTTLTVTLIGLSGDSIVDRGLGMTFDPNDNVFRFFDDGGRYYTMLNDGSVSQVGQTSTTYFGLAYDDRPSPIILFRDGFESGDTSAW